MTTKTQGCTFSHGVHPEEFKEKTAAQTFERMPFAQKFFIPLSQHLGVPSRPIVSPGQKVTRGEVIAEPGGFVSCYQHSPVDGRVKEIALHEHPSGQTKSTIIINADPHSMQLYRGEIPNWQTMEVDELIEKIQWGGFVGLGGAAFPTHVKLKVPKGKKAEFLILNGCECEPYLTCDHRVMLEQPEALYLGIEICMKILGAKRAYIGIENNKADAIEKLRKYKPEALQSEVVPLQVKYPQGAEKMLITAILGREVPSGKLPIDAESIVHNVGTVAAIGEMFMTGRPLIERSLTITGPGIKRPANLIVPVGTQVSEVVEYCGGLLANCRQVLLGGPMMGSSQRTLDIPVLKGTSGILCLTEKEIVQRPEYHCIRCGRCLEACPMFLNPSQLGLLAKKEQYKEMLPHNLMDCIECGCCSFACPSNIPLVQRFRVSKAILREEQARSKK